MNSYLKIYLMAFVILIFSSCSSENDRRNELEKNFNELIEKVCTETDTPGVTVHVKSGKFGEFSMAWGYSDINTQTKVTNDQLFRIGSLTKSFTGAAIIRLAEKGLIDLNKPISEYLGFVNGYEHLSDISVRHLLNMSSGLAKYLSVPFLTESVLPNPLKGYNAEELLAAAFASAPELLFTPGSDFLYSNTNYVLLGMLIEKISGSSYQGYIEEEFIKPLGLTNTHVITDAIIPQGLARGYYDSDENGSYEDWTEMNMSYVWSAGCIASTARDVAVWMNAMAKGNLVSKDLWAYLFKGKQVAKGVEYGAGILVVDNFGKGHNGTVIGYHADSWYDPDTDSTVAVLSNTNAPLKGEGRDPTKEIASRILELIKE